jgi:octaheme c-type cytochrome (tetrathionate reductase family)
MMKSKLKTGIVSLLVVIVLPSLMLYGVYRLGMKSGNPADMDITLRSEHVSSVDHSQFEILQGEFESPFQVTEACISCHNGRDDEIMATAHWKWEREVEIPGRGVVTIGKKNLINNFCTGANGNNGSCMRCHIGLGWKDKNFDFANSSNVDCLVCHDQTDSYFKQSGEAGMPATEETANAAFSVPDYNYVAQNVGLPKKNNCGVCHFFGGGGNNVKHGDLEKALIGCSRDVDIHMTSDSRDMTCIDCHKTERHNIGGKLYSVSSANVNRITCEQCHTDAPHNDRIIDDHYNKVACQTCHIPVYAKANATKLYWDWSSAGQTDEHGNPYAENDAEGNHNYLSIKGNFVWDDHVKPEYYWFNGTADHYLVTDTISEVPVQINKLFGSYQDSASKIWPVKVHRGKQMYDVDNNTLVNMKLAAKDKGEGAFWKDFDWDKSAELGMEYNGRPYSGNYDFVSTEAYWPLNHMVSSKEETLDCKSCHSRDGRLTDVAGFYMPGRDYSKWVDYGGILLIILSLLGVFGHGMIRVVATNRNKK